MNLIKTSFYTSISTSITFVSGFVVTKVVAVAIGPQGLAYVGQFQNATALFAMLGLAAINAGVIKYLAQFKDEPAKQQSIITTAVTIVISASLFTGLFIVLFSGQLSKAVFHSTDFRVIFLLYALFLLTISLNTLCVSILNGLKEIKKYTIVNISNSLVGLSFTVFFALNYGLKGVLLAASFASAVMLCINFYFLRQTGRVSLLPNFRVWDKKIIRLLFAFALMTVVSGALGPMVQFFIRGSIMQMDSLQSAGYWQAVTRISDYYLSFITTVLGVYYLPRLSELKLNHELRQEVFNGYKIILPVVGLLALAIYLFKGLIIQVLFTPAFEPMKPLFTFQLLGDFFKIGSWLLGFLMLSKAMTSMFIITEIGFSVSLVLASHLLIKQYGAIGATYAFALNYAIYWVVMWVLLKNKLSPNKPDN